SNVNTIGFKSSQVTFSDVLYQTSSAASGPDENTGRAGVNPKQIGLGANFASVKTTMDSTGGSQRTDNPFDLMIEGDGFFIVNNGTSNYFTKAGSFTLDADGTLCTASGYSVMGWQVDPNNPTAIKADTVSPLHVMSAENMYSEPEATTAVHFEGNIDSADSDLAGAGRVTNFTFYDNLGQSYTVQLLVKQNTQGDSLIKNEYNVSVTNVLDANGQSIFARQVDDGLGNITYEASAITSVTLGTYTFTAGEIDEETGIPDMEGDAAKLTFNASTGKMVGIGDGEGEKSLDFSIGITGEHPFETINVDFSALTMYANSGKTTIEGSKGGLDNLGKGRTAGNMSGVSIDQSGKIYGVYDNGVSKLLGQVVVAKFANNSGLEAVGNSLFAESQNSGEFDGIGEDITMSGGKFNVGVLESSNVDLASEFTDMITTQRGFQANSRIITTSDTLLEELINLKR
ncbi:MAG: flagellar hook-basal body complex protein, partial [Lachnospiraceae bacterium]|nr:flagellar hook-basal body complex protein [Lachnospiraceae bacterium]